MDRKKRIIRKSLRIDKEAQDKLLELNKYLNSKEKHLGNYVVTESDIFDSAISYYHAYILGDGVEDYATQKMETIIQSNLALILNKHMEPFAKALNHLNEISSKNLDAAFILMYYSKLLPQDQQQITNLLIESEKYHEVIDRANIVKAKLMEEQ